MYEDGETKSREHNIGTSGKVLSVQPETEAHVVKGAPHGYFWLRVTLTNARHEPRAVFWGNPVCHIVGRIKSSVTRR